MELVGIISAWGQWVWLQGAVSGGRIDYLVMKYPTPLVSVLFCSIIPTFCSIFVIAF